MKKKLLKIVAIALLCITITTPTINASFAMEMSEKEKINETLKSERFERIDLSEVPEGVTPIVVNSEEELQDALENLENEISEMSKPVVYDLESNENDTKNILLRSARSAIVPKPRYKNFHEKKKMNLTTHNVFGTLKIVGNNIKSVHNLKQDWTGFLLGTKYKKHPSKNITYTLVNKKQTAKITAPYKVDLYIFYENIGHVGSKYGSNTFYVKK